MQRIQVCMPLPRDYLLLIMVQGDLSHTNANKHLQRSQQGSNITAGKQAPRGSTRGDLKVLQHTCLLALNMKNNSGD